MSANPSIDMQRICVLLERIAVAIERQNTPPITLSVTPPMTDLPTAGVDDRLPPSPSTPTPPAPPVFSTVSEAREWLRERFEAHRLSKRCYAELAQVKDTYGFKSIQSTIGFCKQDIVLELATAEANRTRGA